MKDAVNREQFWEDVKQGSTIKALAKKYGLEWSEARALRQELEAGEPGELEPAAEPANDLVPEAYCPSITIPTARLMDLLRGLEAEEILEAVEQLNPQVQADLLQAVLQKKFDRLLEPKTVPMPTLVSSAG